MYVFYLWFMLRYREGDLGGLSFILITNGLVQ